MVVKAENSISSFSPPDRFALTTRLFLVKSFYALSAWLYWRWLAITVPWLLFIN